MDAPDTLWEIGDAEIGVLFSVAEIDLGLPDARSVWVGRSSHPDEFIPARVPVGPDRGRAWADRLR